jgi:hypothetical protein
MSIGSALGKIVGSGASTIVESIGNTVDKFITTDKEREQLKQELIKTVLDNQTIMEQELTKRLQADMVSDSWLSKNIRPMVMLFVLALYSLFSVLDGNIGNFKINSSYIELLGQWGIVIMSFYFGSRGFEKVFTIINNKK